MERKVEHFTKKILVTKVKIMANHIYYFVFTLIDKVLSLFHFIYISKCPVENHEQSVIILILYTGKVIKTN